MSVASTEVILTTNILKYGQLFTLRNAFISAQALSELVP